MRRGDADEPEAAESRSPFSPREPQAEQEPTGRDAETADEAMIYDKLRKGEDPTGHIEAIHQRTQDDAIAVSLTYEVLLWQLSTTNAEYANIHMEEFMEGIELPTCR